MRNLIKGAVASFFVTSAAFPASYSVNDLLDNQKIVSRYFELSLVSLALECGVEEKLFDATAQAKISMALASDNAKLSDMYGTDTHLQAYKIVRSVAKEDVEKEGGCASHKMAVAKKFLIDLASK